MCLEWWFRNGLGNEFCLKPESHRSPILCRLCWWSHGQREQRLQITMSLSFQASSVRGWFYRPEKYWWRCSLLCLRNKDTRFQNDFEFYTQTLHASQNVSRLRRPPLLLSYIIFIDVITTCRSCQSLNRPHAELAAEKWELLPCYGCTWTKSSYS